MLRISLIIIMILFAYLFFWPVPVEPVSWDAPKNKGFVGAFEPNNRLSKIEFIELTDTHGPAGLALLLRQRCGVQHRRLLCSSLSGRS